MGSFIGLAAMTVQASQELMPLLGMLRHNGTITQIQYERLRRYAMNRAPPAAEQAGQLAAESAPTKKSKKKRE